MQPINALPDFGKIFSNKIRIKNTNILLFILLSLGLLLRVSFLGYNTLGHGEAEMAASISYVMPCLRNYSYLGAAWRLWHIFIMFHNPMFTTIFPINFTLAWFFGINEFVVRFHAVIGGMISALMIYLLVRRHSDEITAFLALTLFVFNPYLIIYNRFALHDSMQIAIALIAILFLDTYFRKRKLLFLVLSSVCFSLSFLIKMQAAIFISILVLLYFLYFRLKIREVCLIIAVASVFTVFLFIDQLGLFLNSLMMSKRAAFNLSVFFATMRFYASAHIKYFEATILPLSICLLLWHKIENKLFRLLVVFTIVYFAAIIIQCRPFFRYLQAGIIAISMALAFPLRKFTVKKYFYSGFIALIVLLSWSLYVHRTYIFAVYHHIPYKYIAKMANELRGTGRILIYGRNSETEHYLSPTGNYQHNESINPCQAGYSWRVSKYDVMFNSVLKIDPELSTLFIPKIVHPGDLLVVTGMQMVGGEPAPYLHGYDGGGFRVYRHDLRMPNEFYRTFMTDKKMQDNLLLLEKIYLTNGSKELAALILRKK